MSRHPCCSPVCAGEASALTPPGPGEGRKRNRPETPELPLFAGGDGGSAADVSG
jgi:hypothetical protein